MSSFKKIGVMFIWLVFGLGYAQTKSNWTIWVEQKRPTELNLFMQPPSEEVIDPNNEPIFVFKNPENAFVLIGNTKRIEDKTEPIFKQLLIFNKEHTVNLVEVEVNYTIKNGNALHQKRVSLGFNLQELKSKQELTQTVLKLDDVDIKPSSDRGSLWAFMLLAFASGLAALLTPCVFPMIPLTVSYFGTKNRSSTNVTVKNESGTLFRNGSLNKALLFGFFIILIYVIIGTIVARINGPEFANWLSTHWLPNVLFFIIFLVFALSFLGMFELTLPHSWVNKIDGLSNNKGIVGEFFMAFTLVLISFSCTGPIVGSVLVLSAGGAVIKPIAGMFAFSLALALPFTLFAAFPKWVAKLPKSGGWLQEVKVVLGFLELALALKFLSVADQVYHWGILDREIYLALWIAIFTILGFYLLGNIRLPYHTNQKTTSVPKLILAIFVFGFVVYLIPGMIGSPLKPLSGYLPPITSQEFNLSLQKAPKELVKAQPFDVNSRAIRDLQLENAQQVNCPTPKHNDLFRLPHGLEGFFDLEQAKECAKIQNKPIFIDFTGHGCVNCRAMEARVWSDPNILNILNEKYIVVALYVDDKTELPKEDWYVSKYDGKTKKTIGKQNADFQIVEFNNNAQPFYVLVNHDGKQLAKPKAYDLDIDNFKEFLESGLKEFENYNINK